MYDYSYTTTFHNIELDRVRWPELGTPRHICSRDPSRSNRPTRYIPQALHHRQSTHHQSPKYRTHPQPRRTTRTHAHSSPQCGGRRASGPAQWTCKREPARRSPTGRIGCLSRSGSDDTDGRALAVCRELLKSDRGRAVVRVRKGGEAVLDKDVAELVWSVQFNAVQQAAYTAGVDSALREKGGASRGGDVR